MTKKSKLKYIVYIFVVIGFIFIISTYCLLNGERKSITDINENEASRIADVFGLSLGEDDEIVAFRYMTVIRDSFLVVEIEVKNLQEFAEKNKELFEDIYEMKHTLLFKNGDYRPKYEEFTVRYEDNYVYLSTDSVNHREIFSLFQKLYYRKQK